MLRATRLLPIFVLFNAALAPVLACAQQDPVVGTLKPREEAKGLFVASVFPPGSKHKKGRPALANLDPIALFVDGHPRTCQNENPRTNEPWVPEATIHGLDRFYLRGSKYPLWYAGAPLGAVTAVKSCIEGSDGGYQDLGGCFTANLEQVPNLPKREFKGTVWTGEPRQPIHEPERSTASTEDRALFLKSAAAAYATHHVLVVPNSIHAGPVIRTRLQPGYEALAGSTIVQLGSKERNNLYSYRVFLVLEKGAGEYQPVLIRYRRATLPGGKKQYRPQPGEIIDEEEFNDRESFVDSFPLYPGEPDAIVTEHTYYESWAYSVYRRVGPNYHLLYTGCGGGT